MKPITIPNISIPTIGIPTIGIPSVGFPSASGGGGLSWPAGMKEHIKAWYDPKKQGMTNFDVIEAYVEDFTNWNYVKARGVVTISQHKFIITECILNGLGIVEDIQEPYSNLTVRITGITDNQEVLITDYFNGQHQIINTITEDGIYTIEDRHHFVGFGCNFVGTCNITIEQLPTSILKDFSGNGNHAYLYGGKGKLNSGMGVYKEDFTTWNYVPERGDVTRSYNTIHITKVTNTVTANIISKTNEFGNSITLKIVGATSDNPLMVGTYSKPNGYTAISKDGVYSFEIDEQYWGFRFNKDGDVNVTITQIPDYPAQLCYDGKMYAVCYGFPILTDYTVMAERTWFEIGNNSCFASKRIGANKGAFAIEYRKLYAENFGSYNAITFVANKKEIIVQSKEKYNDKDLIAGNEIDTNQLLIGGISLNNNRLNEPYIGCHGAIIIADRSFTEEEINWLKQNWDKI